MGELDVVEYWHYQLLIWRLISKRVNSNLKCNDLKKDNGHRDSCLLVLFFAQTNDEQGSHDALPPSYQC